MTQRLTIIQRWLDSIGLGEVQNWPVLKGNDVTVLQIRTSVILSAEVGDVVKVKGGGYVKKIGDSGWVQWQWFPDRAEAEQMQSEPAIPPPGSRLL